MVAGGSGALGRRLCEDLAAAGHEVVVLTRRPRGGPSRQVAWDGRTVGPWQRELEGAAVVNLAGELVDRRPTPANVDLLTRSRVDPTRALVAASASLAAPTPVWVQISTLAIYGDAHDDVLDESASPADGPPQMAGRGPGLGAGRRRRPHRAVGRAAHRDRAGPRDPGPRAAAGPGPLGPRRPRGSGHPVDELDPRRGLARDRPRGPRAPVDRAERRRPRHGTAPGAQRRPDGRRTPQRRPAGRAADPRAAGAPGCACCCARTRRWRSPDGAPCPPGCWRPASSSVTRTSTRRSRTSTPAEAPPSLRSPEMPTGPGRDPGPVTRARGGI